MEHGFTLFYSSKSKLKETRGFEFYYKPVHINNSIWAILWSNFGYKHYKLIKNFNKVPLHVLFFIMSFLLFWRHHSIIHIILISSFLSCSNYRQHFVGPEVVWNAHSDYNL